MDWLKELSGYIGKVDWLVMLVHFFASSIIIWIIWKFLLLPVRRNILRRKNYIRNEIKKSTDISEILVKKKDDFDLFIKNKEKEMVEKRKEIEYEFLIIREKIIKKAFGDAKKIYEEAEKERKKREFEFKKDQRKMLATLSFFLIQKTLRKGIKENNLLDNLEKEYEKELKSLLEKGL